MEQKNRYSKYLALLLIVGDFVILNLTFLNLFWFFHYYTHIDFLDRFSWMIGLLNLSFLPAWLLLWLTVYRNIIFADEIVQHTFYLILSHMILFLAALVLFQVDDISRTFIFTFFGILSVTMSSWRLAFRFSLKRYRKKGFNYKLVVIIGTGKNALALYKEMIGDQSYVYKVLGFFDDRLPRKQCDKFLGDLDDAFTFISENQVDEVYCAYSDSKRKKIRNIIAYCENNCIRFFIVPRIREILPKQYELGALGAIPVLSLHKEPLQLLHNRIIKRTFDILFSSIVLLTIFPPVLLIVGTLIKLTSSGPVFFGQCRNGEMGNIFICWKFRSMVMNHDSDKKQTVHDDPRKTWIGNIIRKTSIDELPQFYNVLKGDMSVVGPRPHMLEHTRVYSELVDKYMLRHLVKPGITGWAQIHGLRGEIRDVNFMQRRIEADVWYIEHWTFFLDLKIIYKTFIDAIRGDEHAI